MSMCRKLRPQVNAKAAAATILLLLVLVACHAFSAHGAGEVDESGGGRRELEEDSESKVNVVTGLCIDSPCDADPNRTCFCCTRLANEPCYDTMKQCVSVCPVCNFLVCPPPPARRTRRLGSPPASTA